MNMQIPMQAGSQSSNFMVILGGVIVAGVLIYSVFMAINNLGLQKKEGLATVVGKGYREAGRTYITQVVGKRTLTIPQTTPEMYILKLDIGGRQTEYAASRSLHNELNAGDKVRVAYQRKRITGSLQVLDVIK